MARERVAYEIHDLPFPITLKQSNGAGTHVFSVTYGKQERQRLTYAEAAKELGECIMHAATCAGLVDSEA